MSESAPTTLELYLNSGQIITLKVIDWKLTKRAGVISEITMTTLDHVKVPYLSLENIVAVVERGN